MKSIFKKLFTKKVHSSCSNEENIIIGSNILLSPTEIRSIINSNNEALREFIIEKLHLSEEDIQNYTEYVIPNIQTIDMSEGGYLIPRFWGEKYPIKHYDARDRVSLPTEQGSNAIVILCQLVWLVREYNNGKDVCWQDTNEKKYTIVRKFGGSEKYIVREARYEYSSPLTFSDRIVAETFLKEQIQLVDEYFSNLIK